MTAWLYRLHDADGHLLYIGCSRVDVEKRTLAHRRKPWGHRIATVSTESYPTHAAALKAEQKAIASEEPAYNIGPGGYVSGPRGTTESLHWQTADQALQRRNYGDLATWLTDQRATGLSYSIIAFNLHTVTDRKVQVTPQTIRNWVKGLERLAEIENA